MLNGLSIVCPVVVSATVYFGHLSGLAEFMLSQMKQFAARNDYGRKDLEKEQ